MQRHGAQLLAVLKSLRPMRVLWRRGLHTYEMASCLPEEIGTNGTLDRFPPRYRYTYTYTGNVVFLRR
jgi:hypothetical protein